MPSDVSQILVWLCLCVVCGMCVSVRGEGEGQGLFRHMYKVTLAYTTAEHKVTLAAE